MVTVDEELQAKEFLKRAEIRTMKKDLMALREVDSLKERDKIAHIKTLEEQRAEQQKKMEEAAVAKAMADKMEMEEVLTKNANQERVAEKDLKNYASEEERQKIFLFESSRLALEKQIDEIDKEKDPALKLEKNKLLLQKRNQQEKLNLILDQEGKLEGEQKVIIEKEQTTASPSEKKGLEQSRWDLDKKIQDVEKKRWEAEKQIQDTDNQVGQIDKLSEQLVIEKNGLRDNVLGVDKSLREIYSTVMEREEEKRKGQADYQKTQKEALTRARTEQKESIQRQQWTHSPSSGQTGSTIASFKKPLNIQIPVPVKNAPQGTSKMAQSFEAENEARKKFMQDVEASTDTKK